MMRTSTIVISYTPHHQTPASEIVRYSSVANEFTNNECRFESMLARVLSGQESIYRELAAGKMKLGGGGCNEQGWTWVLFCLDAILGCQIYLMAWMAWPSGLARWTSGWRPFAGWLTLVDSFRSAPLKPSYFGLYIFYTPRKS
jgi:hypothetical protein